ncbi:helix-turn-helix domain-containing protein [Sphingobacterium bambusae]|uniref:Helix-turn-helix domain-containing protein n=1 Tax=Sphingobacterium bambusae TaxID=662858 RepID=A0ABW6BCT8_9SPHI|nr:helix-turn-helix transcriptional regulator [Sphingobacterium bambusae]WPL48769.1 helix-turn-helix transcriptional regulator [Sphingobacterium bambusae]
MSDIPVSTLKLHQIVDLMLVPQRNRDYVVAAASYHDMQISLARFYRAEYFGLILIEQGSSYYSVGDYEYEVKAGDILFCVPQEIFKVHLLSADYKASQIFFSADMLSDAGFNYRSNDILKSFSSNPSYVIMDQKALFDRLKFHIQELSYLNDFRNAVYFHHEMIWHHFSLLMYEFENYTKQNKVNTKTTSREEAITTAFFALVRQFYIQHHDVQFYADKLFISRKYLSRVIKSSMDHSPKDIINQVLLIEAKILLRNTANNVNQVAGILHFSNQAVFSKFFKKLSGKTPLDYKSDDLF